MSSDIQNDDVFYCRPCNLAFYTWEALHKHKGEMRSAGRPSHIHCKHCGQDFKTGLSEIQHIQQFHPQEQKLVCRACGMGPFARASGLIGHIEQGQCSKLTMETIEEQREKKSEFARCLQAISGSPVRNDFSKYIGGFSTASSVGGQRSVKNQQRQKLQADGPLIDGLDERSVAGEQRQEEKKQVDGPFIAGLADKPMTKGQQKQSDDMAATKQQHHHQYKQGKQDGPLVAGLADKPVQQQQHEVDMLLILGLTDDPVSGLADNPIFEQKRQRDGPLIAGLADRPVQEQKQPEGPLVAGLVAEPVVRNQQQAQQQQPQQKQPQQPANQQQALQPMPGPQQQPVEVVESMDRDHPDHPTFNARRYYNTYAQAYVCPKLSCNKVFNKATGFMAHLRSPAHAEKKYHCPYCNRRFPTMTAIVSHAEQSSARCHIRESDNYEAFMDQLTGGVIDVGFDRHEDGTVKYDMGNVEW
ncbi:hypothetical protein CP532_3955 [Ophiocordyceps camponoti-leonardi (nom. inval.)]|nr:hypothetical protein CP532_3955 [Ophiocordyceps camponoti-leonardi (nom. inval.)]